MLTVLLPLLLGTLACFGLGKLDAPYGRALTALAAGGVAGCGAAGAGAGGVGVFTAGAGGGGVLSGDD